MYKTVYGYDENGFYTGECQAQLDKNGEIMMPACTTEIVPIKPKSSHDVVFKDGGWSYVSNLPTEEELSKIEIERVKEEAESNRMKPYNEIQHLESLITPRRLRERDMGIEQYVDPDNGGDLAEVDGGMPYIKWVYKKIVEQQAVIRQSK